MRRPIAWRRYRDRDAIVTSMRLRSLARHWEILARRDPLRAALTDRERSVEEFFRSGEEELRSVLNQAEAVGITIDRSRALDFGCGVGRLTQAMARHFAQCDGVDIAASMIASAQRHNHTGTPAITTSTTQPIPSCFRIAPSP